MQIGFIGNIPPPVGGAEVFLRQFLGRFLRATRHAGTLVRWRKQRFFYFPETITRVYAPPGTVKRVGRFKAHYLLEALIPRRGERRRAFERRLIPHYIQHGLDAARIFQRAGVELIHAHMLFPNLFIAAVAAEALSVPLVLTIHGMLEFRILEHMRTKYPGLAQSMDGSLAKADAVVGVSDEIAAECRRRGARTATTLPVGVDTAFFRPLNGVRPQGKDLLFIGSVRREKGAAILIQAFERIRDGLDGNLVFIGPRLLRGAVYARARRTRRIRFLGVQDASAIRQALRRARLVVLPSMSEGLPLSILEAMASQVPVLVTRTGALTHLIQHGRNGFLIRRRSPAALAEQIGEVVRRPDLHAIGRRGRRTALQFDIQTVVRRHEALYRSLIT